MKIALILGDQLSHSLSVLDVLDKNNDLLVMAEVGAEATYTWHHKQKVALIFSAMRHFDRELISQRAQAVLEHIDTLSCFWISPDALKTALSIAR